MEMRMDPSSTARILSHQDSPSATKDAEVCHDPTFTTEGRKEGATLVENINIYGEGPNGLKSST